MHLIPARLAVLAALLACVAGAQAQAPRTAVAGFDGLWCGTGLLHEFRLRLTQQERDVQGVLVRRDRRRELEGHVEGATLHTQATKIGSLLLQRAGDELRVTGGDGLLALVRGATFQRADGPACSG